MAETETGKETTIEAPKPDVPKPDAGELRLRARIAVLRKIAAGALLWETLWPAFWPAIMIAGSFLALALFDVLPMLPAWLHGLALSGFAGAFLVSVYRARAYLRLPSARAAERRIEQASALAHRPLAALNDRPAEEPLSPAQSDLWRVHRERMAAAIKRLRIGFPHASLAARDPLGLRVVLALILVVALVDARTDAGRRIARAVTPHFADIAAAAPTLDVWVAPPDYTGLPTAVLAKSTAGEALRKQQGETVNVPAGSTLFAQVHGGRNAPKLKLGTKEQAFAPLGPDSYQARVTLRDPVKLSIEQNHGRLAGWTLAVVPDQPPTIDFKDKPAQSERGALRISFRAADDYGVVSAKGIITRAAPDSGGDSTGDSNPDSDAESNDSSAAAADGGSIEVPLALPGGRVTKAEGASYHDLTAHPWAGTKVTLHLEAKDGAGQTGSSGSVTFVLPERQFHNEVARAIAAERKKLTLNPKARRDVAQDLAQIEQQPDKFHGDVVVYMALNSAIGRLLLDRNEKAIPEVQKLLWDTALRLEDDGASLAQRDLRDLQKQLKDALARGADPKEIKQLMDKLQQAMDRYLEAMSREMEGGQPPQEGEPSAESQTFRPEDLRNMLDKARELAEMGDTEAARQMLSKLEDILENLRAPQPGQSQAQQQSREAMKKMQDLIKRQQNLLDRTYNNAKPPMAQPGELPEEQQGGPGGKPGPQAQKGQGKPGKGKAGPPANADAAEQEALRKELGDTMLKFGDMLGKIPGELGRAERAMRDSEDALKEGKPGEAVGPQTKAVDQLQQGMEALRQEMAKQGQQGQPGGPPGPGAQGKDPLGRPLPDRGGMGAATGEVRIPEQMELRRAREILDELRKRAGQPSRPEEERDYIDRLLPTF